MAVMSIGIEGVEVGLAEAILTQEVRSALWIGFPRRQQIALAQLKGLRTQRHLRFHLQTVLHIQTIQR
jgi:hypothetical protein